MDNVGAYYQKLKRNLQGNNRKTCFVPKCYNSTKKTKGKIFVSVPHDLGVRKQWAKAAGRPDAETLTSRWRWHCCEDHFEVRFSLFWHCIALILLGSCRRS